MRYPPTEKYDTAGFAPPLKPGDYVIKISDVRDVDKEGQPYTDKDGFEYSLFEFTVKDHPGNKLFDRFCFDEGNQYANINFGRFKQLQIACGVDITKDGDTASMIGKTCKAYVKTKEYQGKVNNNIVEYKDTVDEFPADQTASNSDDEDLPF